MRLFHNELEQICYHQDDDLLSTTSRTRTSSILALQQSNNNLGFVSTISNPINRQRWVYSRHTYSFCNPSVAWRTLDESSNCLNAVAQTVENKYAFLWWSFANIMELVSAPESRDARIIEICSKSGIKNTKYKITSNKRRYRKLLNLGSNKGGTGSDK